MSGHIDFRTLPANIPSLCIPRVFSNIDERRIYRIFDDLGLGDIDRINIVRGNNAKGEKCNRVFIHFTRWYNSRNADTARERLLNGNDIKVIYDDPWFWKVAAYREAPPSHRVQSDRSASDRSANDRSANDRRVSDRSVNDRSVNDRRTDRRTDRRPDRRPSPTREELDKELEKINPSIKNAPNLQPKVVEEEIVTEGDGIKYDLNIINNSKKRKIIIKKPEVKATSVSILTEEINKE
jgi:hypothetical protein